MTIRVTFSTVGLRPQTQGFWSPTRTVKNPQIPYLPLETPAAVGGSSAKAVIYFTQLRRQTR